MSANEWVSIADKRPHIGDRCLICINGIVQHEVYIYDESDDEPPFWFRYGVDDLPSVEPEHLWMPLPRLDKVSIVGLVDVSSLSYSAGLKALMNGKLKD